VNFCTKPGRPNVGSLTRSQHRASINSTPLRFITAHLGGKLRAQVAGGFLLFYCEPPYQTAVREIMREEGVHEMTFGFDTQGAQVIVNDPFIDSDERGGSRWVFVPKAPAERSRVD
jgi:hypothetical protein